MMFGRFSILLFFALAISAKAYSQDRYAVFFKFKPQTTLSLSNPKGFLTQKALDRRTREKIQADSLDLPVAEKYVAQLVPLSNYLLYTSKWLNAVVLVTDEAKSKTIQALPFVDRVELIARGFLPRPGGRVASEAISDEKIHPKWQFRESSVQNNSYDFQNQLIGIDKMHQSGFTGKGVTIAVFDAGFPGMKTASTFAHLFSKNQIIGQKDVVRPWNSDVFLDNQHGTNVSSLIASNEPSKLVSGAYDANYIFAITEEVATEYRIEEFNWVRAAEYADSLGVDVINSSVGYIDFDDPVMTYTKQQMDGKTTYITRGATVAAKKGILVVNSVGNYGGAGASSLIAPADAAGILSVGSVTSTSTVSGFSSRGPTADGRIKPELVAFGQAPILVRSNGTVGTGQGTSFSAPQIAALAAGLWQARPEWTKDQLILNLLRSASQYDKPDNNLGYGIPNFTKAYFGEILSVDSQEIMDFRIFPNPLSSTELFLDFGMDTQLDLKVFDVSGRKVAEERLFRTTKSESYRASLPNLQPGLYLLQLTDGNRIYRTKLLKK
jgi:subtilisin family serine protease